MLLCCLGNKVQYPGQAVGRGLTLEASRELGLLEGTVVATSLIDAHAGGLGKWKELIFFYSVGGMLVEEHSIAGYFVGRNLEYLFW